MKGECEYGDSEILGSKGGLGRNGCRSLVPAERSWEEGIRFAILHGTELGVYISWCLLYEIEMISCAPHFILCI